MMWLSSIPWVKKKALFGRVHNLGYEIKLTDAAKDFIADKGFDSNFGARPLKRAIQKYLEDPIAEEILKGDVNEGDVLEIDYNKESDQITVENRSPGKKKKKEEGA
jgi:ATP-dependent Clp protease ATP-binding subunit ClpC